MLKNPNVTWTKTCYTSLGQKNNFFLLRMITALAFLWSLKQTFDQWFFWLDISKIILDIHYEINLISFSCILRKYKVKV